MVGYFPMRTAARLTIAFIAAFSFFLAAGTSVSVMRSWLEAAQAVPAITSFPLASKIFDSVSGAVPLAVFGALLLTIPLTARRVSGLMITGLTLFVLSGAAFFSLTYGVQSFSEAAKTANETVPIRSLGTAGLVVNTPAETIAFAGASAVAISSKDTLRVIPSGNANAVISRAGTIPPLGSSLDDNKTIAALTGDFQGCARRLETYSEAGWDKLLAYSCALALLLSSFCALAGATRWPLADLALCALGFRGILIFEDIISSGSVLRFAQGVSAGLPEPFIVPIILGACGVFIFMVGVILRLTRGRMESHG